LEGPPSPTLPAVPAGSPGTTTFDTVIIVVVLVLELGGVALTMLTLSRHPAPVLGRRSLRRSATGLLASDLPPVRRLATLVDAPGRLRRARVGVYVLAFLALMLPIPLRVGPLDSEPESTDYLQTMWQVVAAALGVTVAMVAFAFEAFASSAQHRYGGTLREFAAETRLLLVIRLGALALLVDGAVLLGVGHAAPAGWSAGWAIFLSAATLAAVPWVVGRILRSLDPTELTALRRRRLIATASAAVRQQLRGQAADVVLANLGPGWPTSQILLAEPGVGTVPAARAGEILDVRLGPLARVIGRERRRGTALALTLHVGLGDQVGLGDIVLSAGVPLGARDQRRLRRCVRVGETDTRRADRLLLSQLDALHVQAKAAVREHREEDWREIADLYELVLLRLPTETRRLGIAFDGAVARPGLLGFGPVQRIAGFFIDELSVAIAAEATELIDPIAYRPQAIADQATRLGAPAVAREMLDLYPRMYGLAIRGGS
jgi:hypothetical protein